MPTQHHEAAVSKQLTRIVAGGSACSVTRGRQQITFWPAVAWMKDGVLYW